MEEGETFDSGKEEPRSGKARLEASPNATMFAGLNGRGGGFHDTTQRELRGVDCHVRQD